MQKEIHFIHAADLHLDSPFKGLNHVPERVFSDIRNSTFQALENLIEISIEKKLILFYL